MKKPLVALIGMVAMVVVPSAAFADEPTGDGVYRLPVITIYGKRPSKPSVVIELTRPTAAAAAGAAHESLREELLKASMPPALKAADQAREAH